MATPSSGRFGVHLRGMASRSHVLRSVPPSEAFWDQYYWLAMGAVVLLALVTQYPWPPGDLHADALFILWTLAGFLASRRYPFAARLVHALGVLPLLAYYAHRTDTATPYAMHPYLFVLLAFFPLYTVTAMVGGWGYALALLLAWILGSPLFDRPELVAVAFFFWSLTGLVAIGYHRVIEQNRLYQRQLEELALEDPLTGLRNRRALEEDFQRLRALARREGRPLILTLWDLNDLKTINDRYGHTAGDRLLKRFAEALVASVRTGDVLYRIGGDEFAGLHLGCQDPDALIRRVRKAFPWTSAGWVEASRHELEEAYRQVDRRLYRDKAGKPRGLPWSAGNGV